MVDFAGWEMPILYRGIGDEHQQTRNSGSLFDVSHMGRLSFTGKDVVPFLNKVLTRNVTDQRVGQSRYSLVCNEAGFVLDDVIISKDAQNWILVVNASNRQKILDHFNAVLKSTGFAVEMTDNTESTAMVAIQGPKVVERMSQILPVDIKAMKRYRFETGTFMFIKFTCFRSGYTGEDGIELILPAKTAGIGIKMLAGKDHPGSTIRPAGLGARDTLRMEAGMPLYGHELTESIDPLSAGLHFAVDLTKDFIGVEPLRAIAAAGPKRKLIGLELEGKRIARQGTPIVLDGKVIGEVTSGTLSPTLGKSIAMAYVDAAHTAEGTVVSADLKGTPNPAKVVPLPFYKRS
jgi:aminomethyltransferase